MIKVIPADRLIVGMFIHDLKCDWLDHPFVKNKFEIGDAATIHKIIEAGIHDVFIDTARGKDVPAEDYDGTCVGTGGAEIDRPVQVSPGPAFSATPHLTLAEEVRRARKLHGEANALVAGIMHDVRLGKQIEVEKCQPLVDSIFDSVFRVPSALLPLAQMKNRDEYTFQHSVSVAALAVAFGRALDLPHQDIKDLTMGGLLHDVGKARVPDAILNKPGKLTDDEFAVMKNHAKRGADLLKNTPGIGKIAYSAAAEHHERYDGSGYPHGLRGEEITLYGQMLAIVDVYDAITSIRVYHKNMPATDALRKMFEWSKFHFNPRLVQAFIKAIGIYPAGSLVRMESGRMGIVREVVPSKLLQPVVTIFYHAEKRCYLPAETIDLSVSTDKIVAHESFEKWEIDQAKWL